MITGFRGFIGGVVLVRVDTREVWFVVVVLVFVEFFDVTEFVVFLTPVVWVVIGVEGVMANAPMVGAIGVVIRYGVVIFFVVMIFNHVGVERWVVVF